MTTPTPTAAIITSAAAASAAEAIRQGAPRRAIDSQEDAGEGDYEALARDLGRAATREERAAFRAAFSAALDSAAAAPSWLDVMPPIPLARGVPVLSIGDRCCGIVVVTDVTSAPHVRVRWSGGGEMTESSKILRVDLDDPQGFAYALRWYSQPDIGGEAPHDLLDAWVHDALTDADRLALARACAEASRA